MTSDTRTRPALSSPAAVPGASPAPSAAPSAAVSGDLGIAVPASWRRRSDPARGVLVAARSSMLPASGIRPELTLRCAPVGDPDDDPPSLAGWRDTALEELAEALVDFALEDDDEFDLDGHDVAYRRFAHRVGTTDVLCDQWAWLVAGPGASGACLGVTLTCSAARQDYPAYCDVFEAIAETVDLAPRTTPRAR